MGRLFSTVGGRGSQLGCRSGAGVFVFNGFWLGMRTGGLGGGRLYTQCLGLHYLFHFKSHQSSRAGPSKGLVRAFLCIYGRRVECPGVVRSRVILENPIC